VTNDTAPTDPAPEPSRPFIAAERVSPGVRVAAAWSWRLLLIGVAVVTVGWLFIRFEDVTVPVTLALLFAALLHPLVAWATGKGLGRATAAVAAVVLAVLVVLGVLAFVVQQSVAGGPELAAEFSQTIDDTRNWLATGPLKIDSDQLHAVSNEMTTWIKAHESFIASHALSTAGLFSRIGAGFLLTVFLLLFFLYDGRGMWNFVTKAVPAAGRERVRGAGAAGFHTLEQYVKATVLVAAIDSIIIGIGLAALGVPLVLPLVVIIFLGAFIPIVGSFVAGFLAVLVALTTQGWLNAVIVLCILVFVMAFEGHILQPFVLGNAVKLHPVAVIVAIALGIMLAGIVGGVLAVPLVAFLDTALRWYPGRPAPVRKDSRLTRWIRRRTVGAADTGRPAPPTADAGAVSSDGATDAGPRATGE